MVAKITDPNSFLRQLVTRKGRSDYDGVVLTSVNVQADALEDYGYEVSILDIERDIRNLFARDENDWNRLLVGTRQTETEIVHPISFIHGTEPTTIYFITEDHFMSAMVFLPSVMLDEFAYEVTLFQQLLRKVASFAGKAPDSLRFTIGVAIAGWGDLVEHGDAQEIEIPG
jgi:hypothetical protein